jgi:hypothetical protein
MSKNKAGVVCVSRLALLTSVFLKMKSGRATHLAIACSLVLVLGCASVEAPKGVHHEKHVPEWFTEAFTSSVFRVLCVRRGWAGTAFAHKSGNVITAGHVVSDCDRSEIELIGSSGSPVKVARVTVDEARDLAILAPIGLPKVSTLPIGGGQGLSIGTPVRTWGYPLNYGSRLPLLTGGYFSGIDTEVAPNGRRVPKLIINAAFNSGNSGGPLIDATNGMVIGVVLSKLAPLPPSVEAAFETLEKRASSVSFAGKSGHVGEEVDVSEWRLVLEVLRYLKRQIQLVVGHAVPATELMAFLREQGIEP